MMNLPKYIPTWYENNPETGYYTKTSKQPIKEVFLTMPYELRVESTQIEDIKTNARLIIRSREKFKNNTYKFFTGLVQIYDTNCYIGNHYKFTKTGKKTSLVIFCFSENNSRLYCFYFPDFDKENIRERVQYAGKILPTLLHNHLALIQ